ncbi:hypothetical protein [Azospirillum doebereinerae]|uniref:DUF4276 family protein n=1 Tax=Azospirillum doebereinerae TaxID=92933 RepID=A0A3S0V350_9PROT|nr:hypothetical protein [Azospirillum doebereinerae]RUQ61987.1 hypothetical protein EJ913_29340 [Azospirillum doebereinerae]
MSELRIGLVAEGITDLIIIQEFISSYCKENATDVVLSFENLQPRFDRTSGGNNGGWELVYKWCLNNPPGVRDGQFFGGGLFDEGMSGLTCDVIVVHLDADICERIGDKSTIVPVPVTASDSRERGLYIYSTIEEWLWPVGSVSDNRHFPAPAVESTEAWLVAALSEDLSPEEDRNILRRLLEVDAELRGVQPPANGKSLKKSEKKYKKFVQIASPHIGKVVEKCPHFEELVSSIFN